MDLPGKLSEKRSSKATSDHDVKYRQLTIDSFTINAIGIESDNNKNKIAIAIENRENKYCSKFCDVDCNVKVILIYFLLYATFTSIWNSQVLTTYIFTLANDSTSILGTVETAQGVAYISTMPIAGYMTDKFSRLFIIRICIFLGAIIIPLGILIILRFQEVYFFYILLPLYATFQCLQNTVLESLFADITQFGNRDYVFSLKYFLSNMGYAMGQFIILLMFIYLGNDWSMFEMNVPIVAGFALWTIPILMLMLLFNHGYFPNISVKPQPKPKRNTNAKLSTKQQNENKKEISEKLSKLQVKKMANKHKKSIDDISLISINDNNNENENENEIGTTINGNNDSNDKNGNENSNDNDLSNSKYSKYIPWLMALYRLILGTGAGMTVKYFVIFFEDILGLGAIAIALIWFLTSMSVGISALFAKKMTNCLGRIWTLIITRIVGIICLIIMAEYSNIKTDNYTLIEKYLLSICYIVRTANMNAGNPLEKAIMMDYAKKENRGKWNSIESLNRSVWTFSAGIGGYVIGKYGFQSIYYITSAIYTFAMFLLFPLICMAIK